MTSGAQVDVANLRRTVGLLFDRLEQSVGPVMPLDHDFFWCVDPEQIYDIYTQRSEFTVGQLSECITQLEEIEADPSRAVHYALVWVGQLLQALGHQVSE